MRIADMLTLTRIMLTPFFLICLVYQKYLPAFLFFGANALTDWVDGIVARLEKKQTKLGAFLDQLADKIFLIPTYATLALTGAIEKWLFILILCRDFSILVGWLIYAIQNKDFKTRSRISGKVAIASQMILFQFILGEEAFPSLKGTWHALTAGLGNYVVASLTFISFVDYTVFGNRVLTQATEEVSHKV